MSRVRVLYCPPKSFLGEKNLQYFHKSVLKNEAIEGLSIKQNGIYVDATGGAGGHSSLIVKHLTKNGLLVILDRDPDAICELNRKFSKLNYVKIIQANFANILRVLQNLRISKIDGMVMDLGISSHQIDDVSRGFCYNKTAKLDMRMEKVGTSAIDVVNGYSVEKLTKIFRDYGEEKFASRIAKAIEVARNKKTIEYTTELSKIIETAIPQRVKRKINSLKRVFQALRIEINDEFGALQSGLQAGFELLNASGRLSVITFHSLEDRIVKNAFHKFIGGCTCPTNFPVCRCGNEVTAKLINKKVILPSEKEIATNKRAKSAKLRILEKL